MMQSFCTFSLFLEIGLKLLISPCILSATKYHTVFFPNIASNTYSVSWKYPKENDDRPNMIFTCFRINVISLIYDMITRIVRVHACVILNFLAILTLP